MASTEQYSCVNKTNLLGLRARRSVFPGQTKADVVHGNGGGVVAELIGGFEKSTGKEVQIETWHEKP